ncbi:MAG TPA: hypothetical protein PLS84_03170 [Salinivirgaceae bacterium]|nr:hypothetical protein [Salinivirgaceae bacterium]
MGTEFTPAIVITALLCLAVFTLFIYQFTIIVKKIRLSKKHTDTTIKTTSVEKNINMMILMHLSYDKIKDKVDIDFEIISKNPSLQVRSSAISALKELATHLEADTNC